MQDFLKDRPAIAPQDANIIAPAALPVQTGALSPFARIVRDETAGFAARPAAVAPAKTANSAASTPAAHTTQVKPVLENGRVTRLVVTCSCGKVTEIACVY